LKHKDYYNEEYIHYLSKKIGTVIEAFDSENFCQSLTGNLEDKELFERLDCIVDALNKSLPRSYTENIKAFFKILVPLSFMTVAVLMCSTFLFVLVYLLQF